MTRGTRDLGLRGGGAGSQNTIDNKSKLVDKADPLVVERAKAYAQALDELETKKDWANKKAEELKSAFGKSKRKRRVRVLGEFSTYVFEMKMSNKLVKEKEQSVK